MVQSPKKLPCVSAQKKAYIRSNTKHNTILLNPTFFTKGFCLIFSTFRPPTSFVPSVLNTESFPISLSSPPPRVCFDSFRRPLQYWKT